MAFVDFIGATAINDNVNTNQDRVDISLVASGEQDLTGGEVQGEQSVRGYIRYAIERDPNTLPESEAVRNKFSELAELRYAYKGIVNSQGKLRVDAWARIPADRPANSFLLKQWRPIDTPNPNGLPVQPQPPEPPDNREEYFLQLIATNEPIAEDLALFDGEVNTSLIPKENNMRDLGSVGKRFKDAHLAGAVNAGSVAAETTFAGQDLNLKKGTNAEGLSAGVNFSTTSGSPNKTSIGAGAQDYLLIAQEVVGQIPSSVIDTPESIPTSGQNGLTNETAETARNGNDWDSRVLATKKLVRIAVLSTPFASLETRTPAISDITYDKPIGFRWLLGKDDEWILLAKNPPADINTPRSEMNLYWYHIRGDAADDVIFGGDGANAGNANAADQLYTLAAGKNWADFVKIEINDGNIYPLNDPANQRIAVIQYDTSYVSRTTQSQQSYQCGTTYHGDSGIAQPVYCTRTVSSTLSDSSESSIQLVGDNQFRLSAAPWSGNTSGLAGGTPPVVAITKIEGYRT